MAAPVVERGRKLVQFPIVNADILLATKAALEWFNENSDTLPTPDELVGVLGKYRFDQLSSTTGRTYRAPSPSDPYEDDEFESDTGEPMDRYDGHPLPPPRPARRRKITARSAPDFSGLADAHLPISYKGLPFNQLPPEWQRHKESWKVKQRDEIAAAQLADRKARGVDEDDYQTGIRAHAAREKRRLREAQLVAAGKAENDRRRARELELEKLALKAAAEERRGGTPTRARGRRPSVARAPRCPTITEEDASPAPLAATTKIAAGEPEGPSPSPATAAPAPAPKTASEPAGAPARKKTRASPVHPPEWAGLEINPKTGIPFGVFGLFYGINYFSDSDDYSDEGETPSATPAANVGVSGVDVDVSALVDSIPSHELKALFVSPDVDAADVDIASIVDSISRDDIEALLGVLRPSASDSREIDTAANFTISDEVMAMVEAIPDGDLDEMMGGILAVSS